MIPSLSWGIAPALLDEGSGIRHGEDAIGTIFRQAYTVLNPKTGKRETRFSKKWYCEFRTPDGERRRVPGYTDRQATEKLLADLQAESARVHVGMLPSGAGLARIPLARHLAEYIAHLEAKNSTAAHVQLVDARCRKLLATGLERWADLDARRVEAALASLRTKGHGSRNGKGGIGAQTSNHYLQQFGGFVAWLALRMGTADPLAELKPLNVKADRRHERRALTEGEFERLLAAASKSAVRWKLAGPERAKLYLVAAYTGLRASELASLTPESFALDGHPATVIVEAGYSKHRREDVVPLPAAIAAQLAPWLAGKSGRLWPGAWAERRHAAAMLRGDLKAAGIPYRDERGRVFDFHALRMTFITNLALAGVPLVHAQRLARHSTPALTSNFYTSLEIVDLARAAEKLVTPKKRQRKIGA